MEDVEVGPRIWDIDEKRIQDVDVGGRVEDADGILDSGCRFGMIKDGDVGCRT